MWASFDTHLSYGEQQGNPSWATSPCIWHWSSTISLCKFGALIKGNICIHKISNENERWPWGAGRESVAIQMWRARFEFPHTYIKLGGVTHIFLCSYRRENPWSLWASQLAYTVLKHRRSFRQWGNWSLTPSCPHTSTLMSCYVCTHTHRHRHTHKCMHTHVIYTEIHTHKRKLAM